MQAMDCLEVGSVSKLVIRVFRTRDNARKQFDVPILNVFLSAFQWWSIPLQQKLCLHTSVFGGICQCVFEVRNGCSYLVVNSSIFPDFQNSLVELIHWVNSNLRQFWQVMYFLTACINQEIFEESAKATKYWSWVLNLMWYFRDQCHFRSFVSRLFVCSCGCRIVLREINLLSGRRCIRAFSAPNGFAYHAKCTTSV